MDQSMWRSSARSRTKSTSRSLGAVRGVQWTFSIHSAYLLKSQSENKKLTMIKLECMNNSQQYLYPQEKMLSWVKILFWLREHLPTVALVVHFTIADMPSSTIFPYFVRKFLENTEIWFSPLEIWVLIALKINKIVINSIKQLHTEIKQSSGARKFVFLASVGWWRCSM